jgi:hypothetical protein
MAEQPELVDQPLGHRLPRDIRAADLDVAVGAGQRSGHLLDQMSRRPRRIAPSSRTRARWKAKSSSLGTLQSRRPLRSAMKPSTDTLIENSSMTPSPQP